jgi:hypothetical protein
MMKTTKTAIEMIREELCSRYGINEDQIKLELYISGVDKEKGMEILNDYTKFKGIGPFYNEEGTRGHTTSNGAFSWVHVDSGKKGEDDEEFIVE